MKKAGQVTPQQVCQARENNFRFSNKTIRNENCFKNAVILYLIVVVLIFFSFLSPALAQNPATTENKSKNNSITLPKINASNLPNVGSALEKEVQVPKNLQLIIKIFFGIERTISISLLIIVLVIWGTSLLLFSNILKLTPFFKNWTRWPVAIGVTILIGLSGTIKNIALFLLNTGDAFAFLKSWSIGPITAIIIVLGIVLNKVFKILERKLVKEGKKEIGGRIGMAVGMQEKMEEGYKFTRDL